MKDCFFLARSAVCSLHEKGLFRRVCIFIYVQFCIADGFSGEKSGAMRKGELALWRLPRSRARPCAVCLKKGYFEGCADGCDTLLLSLQAATCKSLV